MSTYILSEDQRMIKELVDELVENEIRPRSERIDHEAEYPSEGVAFMAESGLAGCILPERYGGAGLDAWSQTAVIESIATACASTAWALAMITEVSECILAGGTDAQKDEYLAELAAGAPACVAAQGRVRADRTESGYILQGRVPHVPNAGRCGYYLVRAMAEDGVKWCLIENGQDGLHFEVEAPLLGMKGCVHGTMILDSATVPAGSVLMKDVSDVYRNASALDMAAIAAGIARGGLEEAIRYDNQRVQFGKTIAQFENTQQVLAGFLAETEAARALVWQAAVIKSAGEDYGYMAACAKTFCSDVAARATRKCLQLMGGYGYSREYPIERKMRDAKMTEILAGNTGSYKADIAREKVVLDNAV